MANFFWCSYKLMLTLCKRISLYETSLVASWERLSLWSKEEQVAVVLAVIFT